MERKSPSAWREWIEMLKTIPHARTVFVSLRVEGVD